MAAVPAGASPAAGPDRRGPVPARTAGAAAADRSPAFARPGRTVRSWPLLVLAAPAAAEVWSGWVGIAQKTGFGLVSPLPGIWPALHLGTTVTLPVGVEAYAAYALRAWLSGEPWIGDRTRRFAKWSAICSFALGMAGQVAYHLMAQAGAARAPWPVTMIVSCLPVLVLAMGTALAHMLRADAAPDAPDSEATGRPRRGPRTSPPGTRADQTRTSARTAGPVHWPSPQDRCGRKPAQSCGPQHRSRGMPGRRRTRRTSSPAGSPQPGSQYLGERCATPVSKAPTNRSTHWPASSTPNRQTGGQVLRRRRRPGSLANAARPLQSVPHSRLDKRKRTDTESRLRSLPSARTH